MPAQTVATHIIKVFIFLNSFPLKYCAKSGARLREEVQKLGVYIPDKSPQSRWSYGYVSAMDLEGRTIWILDAHGYGKRFIVRADEMLTAFVELERAIHEFAVSLILW